MSLVSATARPPAAAISSTTTDATSASFPRPSRLAPTSHTTTDAPRAARRTACARPIPRPPPVTRATRPVSDSFIVSTRSRSGPDVADAVGADVGEAHLAAAECRPLVERPRVLVVTPRLDAVDRPVHEALPADSVHSGDRDGHAAHALAFDMDVTTVGVDRIDDDPSY